MYEPEVDSEAVMMVRVFTLIKEIRKSTTYNVRLINLQRIYAIPFFEVLVSIAVSRTTLHNSYQEMFYFNCSEIYREDLFVVGDGGFDRRHCGGH